MPSMSWFLHKKESRSCANIVVEGVKASNEDHVNNLHEYENIPNNTFLKITLIVNVEKLSNLHNCKNKPNSSGTYSNNDDSILTPRTTVIDLNAKSTYNSSSNKN